MESGKAYSVAESGGPSGYTSSLSANCTIASAVADTIYTCTITNNDVAPQLTVTKVVINDNGNTKVIANFPLFIDGFPVTSGVASTTVAGAHTVSETSSSDYSSAISGDCATNGTITLASGDNKLCVITNDDYSSGSQGGGVYSIVPPVPPLIDVVKVPSPLALPNGPGLVKYTYTLRNIGTVPVTDITMVGDTCSPITLNSGDTNSDAKLDLNETWTYTCSTTIAQTHTNIVTATGWANGISAVDIANATVVVGIPIVPPLIHITKVPSPLTLPNGSGMVTYTKKVTNPGIVALSNVRVTDDKCSPVKYISGDANNNSNLDTSETWTYTCQSNLAKTTTNTAIASGEANGLIARDFAIATVVVAASVASAVPKLPNTGLTPVGGIAIISGVLILALISHFVILKKRRI